MLLNINALIILLSYQCNSHFLHKHNK